MVKSNSTPSTPQGGGNNLHAESRFSEGSPLMEQFSEPKEDREALEDTSHEMDTPEVGRDIFHICYVAKVTRLLSIPLPARLVLRLAVK